MVSGDSRVVIACGQKSSLVIEPRVRGWCRVVVWYEMKKKVSPPLVNEGQTKKKILMYNN